MTTNSRLAPAQRRSQRPGGSRRTCHAKHIATPPRSRIRRRTTQRQEIVRFSWLRNIHQQRQQLVAQRSGVVQPPPVAGALEFVGVQQVFEPLTLMHGCVVPERQRGHSLHSSQDSGPQQQRTRAFVPAYRAQIAPCSTNLVLTRRCDYRIPAANTSPDRAGWTRGQSIE